MPEKEIFARIMESYDTQMTSAEQRIADFLLGHKSQSITFSVATLAKNSGTSEATVVRFAKTLGFQGFLDFKQELLRLASKDLAGPDRYEKLLTKKGASTLAQVADGEVQNIAETLMQCDLKEFEAAANLLQKAKQVYTLGSGLSSHLAKLASYQLTLVGKRSLCLADSSSAFEEQLRLAEPHKDALLVFSVPPYSKSVVSLCEFAHDRGLPFVCVTDRLQNPIVKLSTHRLLAASSSPLPLNSITSSSVLLTALLASLKRPVDGASAFAKGSPLA
jgi:DNA-binding MurR/RpiR family transcriptional regulator